MNIASWLIHTVTVSVREEFEGFDLTEYGDPVLGPQTTVAARVTHRTQVRVGSDRNERLSKFEVASLVEIPVDARVWLPGDDTGDNNDGRRVLDAEHADTKDGSTRLYIAYV